MQSTLIHSTVIGTRRPFYPEGLDVHPSVNSGGAMLVAPDLPPLAHIVSRGDSFWSRTTTAAAPVTAIPTTGYLVALYNGEPANGKSYIIDSVFVVQVAVTAAVQNIGILANLTFNQSAVTVLAAGQTIYPLRGGRPYSGAGKVAVAGTIDSTNGIAANWQPVGTTPSPSNTLQTGTTVDADVRGMFIVPPGSIFALSALAGAATATSIQIGLRWHEVLLPPIN